MDEKSKLILELKDLHRKQRGWQRLVDGESLNMGKVNALTVEQLNAIIESLKKEVIVS